MCPSLLCHRHEPEAPSATATHVYTPCSGVQGSRFGATSYYHSTFHNLPRAFPELCCISRAIQLTNRDQIFLDARNISYILQCPLVSRGGLYANIPLSFNLSGFIVSKIHLSKISRFEILEQLLVCRRMERCTRIKNP